MNESKVDHLSRLPPELLGNIFSRLGELDTSLVHPLSKRLYPFQQATLYRKISLRSYDQLDKLCWTAVNNPHLLAEHVLDADIDLNFNVERNWEPFSMRFFEVDDPLIPSSDRIERLFSILDRVESLAIEGSSRIASIILTPQVAVSSLPKLTTLRLSSSFHGFDDPFNPSFYASLSNYLDLGQLKLQVCRTPASVKLSTKPSPDTTSPLPSLFSLTLNGPLSRSISSVQRLICSFALILELNLEDTAPTSRIYSLLEGLETPEELTHLSLQRYEAFGPSPEGSLLTLVDGLSELSSLDVGGTCASVAPEFFQALHQLPLETLIFSPESDVNLVELGKLIKGRQKHKTLKAIRFDNVGGKIGSRIRDKTAPAWQPEVYKWGRYDDWFLPSWTDSFTATKLEEFEELAEQEGIEVSGNAFEAITVEEEYQEEREERKKWAENLVF
ncbi:uncharacterized protein JCM6883_004126 [Sporobolomyces salmoneus]|uniref:uncharacterized protein n=1 Tax=Sporobolomyces salmoneus TaxID=183962 RepID=UPI00316B0F44